MLYETSRDWRDAPEKRLALFGMSGLGKTHLSRLLRGAQWFHYSVDYRIGTAYLGQQISDMLKREAMAVPALARLLRTDGVVVSPNLSFENLSALSAWVGKPGDPARGGLAFEDYAARQALHREAEIAAMADTGAFVDRAASLYGYPHFVCDTSGSFCEIVDPDDPLDPVLTDLAARALPVWLRGADDHVDTLIARFDRAPKPIYYRPDFLAACWRDYLSDAGLAPEAVDPDAFARHSYAAVIAARQPRYAAIAARWGVVIDAGEVETARDAHDVIELVAAALDERGRGG
ncbi:ATPase [Jannaschia sp. Os4]|uniref:ATPase n=1 Tax=Jannaschia sp. Os4 TaxID=2807617 RepID=UPI00193A0ADC|nr:ATPase [Jannaschia sp. Os4]MBM2576675.1 ATPase [Jannaschia sp. Os4]